MKTFKIILASTLLLNIYAMAQTAKIKEEKTKVIYGINEGTTIDKPAKPGLAVDLAYKSQHVAAGETSDVNITLITELKTGVLKVNLTPLDKTSITVAEQNLEFQLSNEINKLPIDVVVGTINNGTYYINLRLSVEGEGSRVLVVPVKVGTISSKISNKEVETTDKGLSISVSSAQEEIK
ncbi:MAG: Unknown protein [uncultured Sulfurovum sp.]|uniref:Uncharacterized protein n=1 Tax=uncultured Sulfurovum sp. TaxID=269237 RepID=A0A6S6TB34_9BACT|nr:MAG: Unknown protein [uncultured Sulfurovum sp.]